MQVPDEPQPTCNICTSPVHPADAAVLDPDCGCTFHSDCILQWLTGLGATTCPTCNEELQAINHAPLRRVRPRRYASRYAMTASWLFVPVIRAALDMDPFGTTYDAEAYLPPLLWEAIVGRFRADFVARGIQPAQFQGEINAGGYIANTAQERLLYPAQGVHPGDSWIPADHPIYDALHLVAQAAQDPALHSPSPAPPSRPPC